MYVCFDDDDYPNSVYNEGEDKRGRGTPLEPPLPFPSGSLPWVWRGVDGLGRDAILTPRPITVL